ncbi:MAG: hypothetical protein E7328_00475 [Clostridiales bacterium]|nr:hypothetical protein [Clostridiales bacterium]
MERTERMQKIYEDCKYKGQYPEPVHFKYDQHKAALTKYAHLPRWEKIVRATADAVVNQDVIIQPYDKLIGRVNYNDIDPEVLDPDFDYKAFYKGEEGDVEDTIPGYREFYKYNLVLKGIPGHITWDWNYILHYGTEGIRERCLEGLSRFSGDEKARELFEGALIMLDALESWNEKHVAALLEMGKTEEAEICRRVPKYPARTFREALQSFFMQHIVVMKEAPYGGNSPGRIDYYLWPYLEQDLKEGRCTLEEAGELCEELWLRIDERIHRNDAWGETVVLGGSHANGASAVNPLSYLMVKAFMKYDITHPYLYMRMPKDAPKEFVDLAAEYMVKGGNRAQILNDEAIIRALVKNGVPQSDAANYYCGGCMEVGIQGATSDLLFAGFHNIPKVLELCMTGGLSLPDGYKLQNRSYRSLTDFSDFESFYRYFIEEASFFLKISLEFCDLQSEHFDKSRPHPLLSTMVSDCIARGRCIHAGGARYHDYGASLVGIPNAADSLYAIKEAVFERGICTAEELIAACAANFEGCEVLRKKLIALPKYGQECAEADALAARISTDLSKVYRGYVNRFGGRGKFVLLSFQYSPLVGSLTGATPDGRLHGVPAAQSVTPQSMSMTKGITAAINSTVTQPFDLFAGGASTMWDLDPSWADQNVVKALFTTFFEQGGQMFQGNILNVDDLVRAQQHPDEYPNLIVRVGGYSARFIWLDKDLQDDIISRLHHRA